LTNVLLAEYRALVEKKRQLANEIKKDAQSILAEGAKALFEEHPVVGSFGWVQYTPSFNDGEPCEFTKGETFIFSARELEEGDPDEDHKDYEEGGADFSPYSDRNYETKRLDKTLYRDPDDGALYIWGEDRGWEVVENPNYDPVYGDAKQAVDAFVDLFDEDLLKSMFGAYGTKITVTREGVDVTEYDCGY